MTAKCDTHRSTLQRVAGRFVEPHTLVGIAGRHVVPPQSIPCGQPNTECSHKIVGRPDRMAS